MPWRSISWSSAIRICFREIAFREPAIRRAQSGGVPGGRAPLPRQGLSAAGRGSVAVTSVPLLGREVIFSFPAELPHPLLHALNTNSQGRDFARALSSTFGLHALAGVSDLHFDLFPAVDLHLHVALGLPE